VLGMKCGGSHSETRHQRACSDTTAYPPDEVGTLPLHRSSMYSATRREWHDLDAKSAITKIRESPFVHRPVRYCLDNQQLTPLPRSPQWHRVHGTGYWSVVEPERSARRKDQTPRGADRCEWLSTRVDSSQSWPAFASAATEWWARGRWPPRTCGPTTCTSASPPRASGSSPTRPRGSPAPTAHRIEVRGGYRRDNPVSIPVTTSSRPVAIL